MSILTYIKVSIFNKNLKENSGMFVRLNGFLKNKIGVGVIFVIAVITIYVIVTIFAIYSLLVSL